MSDERFWVSTGDIREAYDVVNVVAANMAGIREPDFAKASRELVDRLARAALQVGANGVIWIRITPAEIAGGLGYAFYATGTAVRVTATAPPA